MREENKTRHAVLRKEIFPVTNGISLPEDEEDGFESIFGDGGRENKKSKTDKRNTNQTPPPVKTPMLDKFGVDYTKLAADHKLDPVVGRDREIVRLVEILSRRKKNNPILIGEAGVGKTAIVEGLAELINSKDVMPSLYNKRLVGLDMPALVAGTKYRGQFEDRMKEVIKELTSNPNIILFIDEIHTLMGAGNAEGAMDAANILKPALARGELQCIGATTLKEYRNSIEKDGALERRFQKVMVNPTSADETLQILRNVKERYEEYHNVEYTEDALLACVKLADRYITDRYFPDKAIDIIDEVGAKMHIAKSEVPPEIIQLQEHIDSLEEKKKNAVALQNFELAANFRDQEYFQKQQLVAMQERWSRGDITERGVVEEGDIANVVSAMTGIPVQRIAQEENMRLRNLGKVLKEKVIAQDAAVDKIVKAILRNRVGIKDANRPVGAFMFLGPTGVGKTYLAKKLAEEMFGSADALIRVDMSEYSESFNTSRLVGAPPGYVGHEDGGQLTEKIRRKPYSIVLLDEIEKAHANVFNMLLQVLDEGRLTDGQGRLVDFRNTIIIMTSNAGTRQLKEFGKGVGFNAGNATGIAANEHDKEYARGIIQKSLSKQFSPEFLNRLDEIIMFDQLDMDAIKKIISLELASLYERVEGLGYHLHVSDQAQEFVASKGYDVQFGARPLKRAIQTYIEDVVCERLLSGELQPGDTISIGKCPDKDELTFE